MKTLLALLLLFVASSAFGQPSGGGTGGGNLNYLSQIKISSCSDTNVISYSQAGSEWVCSAAGGGSGALLDISDDSSNESTSIGEIATTGDTDSIFTEPSANKLLIDLTKKWPVAGTADALSANGANCSAGEIPLGINAAGAVEGCYAAPSGSALDLADNGADESTSITEIATSGDTNSVFSEPSANKLLINLGLNWPTADKAGELVTNGANCSAGQIPLGVDVLGAVEGCYTAPSGSALDVGDNDVNESDSVTEIATSGDTNSVFTESSANKLLINLGLNWPTADRAAELVANGANCSAGEIPLGVTAAGAVEGCYTAPVTVLDLNDNDINESTNITEIAFTGDTNFIFSESAPDKLRVNVGLKWPAANAADALAANGANCSANQIPLGVTAAGVAEGCYALPMNVLDLGDDAGNDSADITEIATTGDTDSIFTEPSADKLLIDLTKKWPVSATSDALSANGANCAAGQIPLGVNASGAVEGCYTAPAAILDLNDNGINESTAIAEIAFTGDTNFIFSESAADKLLVNVGLKWPTADKATQLVANGANCSAGQVPLGVDTFGAVEGCTTMISGTAAVLDLGDDAGNDSAGITEVATSGDTNSIFTESAADKLLVNLGLNWPTADKAIELVDNGTNCSAGQVPLGVDTFGAVEGCYFPSTGNPTTFTLDDTTPEVSVGQPYYECAEPVTITDFVDSDGDHSEFSDFWIHITAIDECTFDFTSGELEGNKGASWTAEIGDTLTCYFSTGQDEWSCFVSDPDGTGAFEQENATIVAPLSATTEWTRVCGDAGCASIGSTDGGTTMAFDLDNDQAADCTLSKAAGVSTLNCSNTNFTATPGQTNGDIIFNKSTGTACLTFDPDTGVMTQGTGCGTIDFSFFVTSRVLHSTITSTPRSVTGTECRGSLLKANSATLQRFNLCAANTSGGQMVCFEDWSGNGITADPAGSETIRLTNGTVLAAGNAVDLAPGVGNAFCMFSDSSTAWHILPGAVGVLADGGAS